MKALFATLATCLGLYCAGVTAQGKCDHYLDEECVDAYGSAPVKFEPLFSKPPHFGYGFRVYHDDENSFDGGPPGYDGDVNEVKTWLEYVNETLQIDEDANRVSVYAVLFTNTTGDVSGGNNGCNGLLGKECAGNLKDVLKWAAAIGTDFTNNIFSDHLYKFQENPLTNLSCPAGIFDEFQDFLRISNFANEYEMTFHTPLGLDVGPSGNASYPWARGYTYRSAEEQMAYAGVGIVSRFPLEAPRAFDDIQLELVCARPEAVKGSGDRIDTSAIPTGDGGSTDGDSTDAASGLRAFDSLLVGLIAIGATVLLS